MGTEDGQFLYGAANICLHAFTRAFLERVAKNPLPHHVAKKKIPFADEKGNTVKPKENNGIKLEMFIFDAFEYAETMSCYAVKREDEFSPLKRAEGASGTPETCRDDFSEFCIRSIERAGGKIDRSGGGICEINPLISYNGEDLEKLVGGKILELGEKGIYLTCDNQGQNYNIIQGDRSNSQGSFFKCIKQSILSLCKFGVGLPNYATSNAQIKT